MAIRHLTRKTALVLAAGALALGACGNVGAGDGLTSGEEDRVRELVRAYLLENPEIIAEAIGELTRKQQMAQLRSEQTMVAPLIEAERANLFANPQSPSIGPEDAPIQMVEFFDYNCSACQNSVDWILGMLEKHEGKIRFVFKESPIFETRVPTSEFAARAALAAWDMGQYEDFHFAMMRAGSLFEDEDVLTVAREVGIDADELLRRANGEGMAERVDANQALMDRLAMSGTPGFIINDTFYPGTYFDEMEDQVEAILAEG